MGKHAGLLMMKNDPLGITGFLSVTLNTGREIHICQLIVEPTYQHLLAGLPDAEMNRRLLESGPERMRGVFGDWPVHTIEPETRFTPPHMNHLPIVRVGALFDSMAKRAELSRLAVIWYQDALTPVLPEAILQQLVRIDWDGMAKTYEL